MRRALLLAALLVGCGETGQDLVTFPVHGAGTGARTFESDEGWAVTIERADVGFGPLYLCATPFADLDVCPRAEAEITEAFTVDALDPAPQMLGDAAAITGTVRSAMFDYGVSWLLTAPGPRALAGAPGGRSAVFRVVAEKDGRVLTVHAAVDLSPRAAGATAVFGARVPTHEITGAEALVVRFDPAAWWRRVRFDELAAADEDGDGAVTVAPGDRSHDALVIAMTSGALPTFEWED